MTADAPTPAPIPGPDACAQALKQQFPALFGATPKPLKLRIQADIRERAPGIFDKAALSAFLRQHTGRTAYLIALTRATHRFDLDGQPCDELKPEHRQAALDELARRRAQREARERSFEDARRERAALLRAFEANKLSVANFCALKGVAPASLDGLLALARREAAERPAAAPTRRNAAPLRRR